MLTDIASISGIVTMVFVIISVWCVWWQLRENTRVSRAANAQSLVDISSPFLLALAQDRSLAELWVCGGSDFAALDVVDKKRYRSMLTWWLMLHENIYYQHKTRLLDSDIYHAWNADLTEFIEAQRLGIHWGEMQHGFEKEFASYVQVLIDRGTCSTSSGNRCD